MTITTRRSLVLRNYEEYLSGFVDREGSFCVSFSPSKRHRFGWEIRPSFSVSQNCDRAEVLWLLKKLWKVGTIRPDRSDKTIKYEVRSITHLCNIVVPHFKKFSLISSKSNDFSIFSEVCEVMKRREHLSVDGFKRILEIAFGMNPSGKRRYSREYILNNTR